MKYSNLLVVLASASLSLSALSFEPWTGEKLFINKELNNTDALKISLKAFGEGTVTDRYGKTEAKYKFQNNNEELVLDMPNNTNTATSYPFVNTLDQGGMQVEMNSTILKITLSGSEYQAVYKTVTKNCYKGYDPVSQMAGKDGCETKESDFRINSIVDTETMSKPLYVDFKAQAGDKFSLPTNDFMQDLYVSLNSDGTVNKLDKNNPVSITNWKIFNGKLVLTSDEGVSYEYQKLRDVHGLIQVLLTVNINDFVGNQKVAVGEAAKDDNLNLSNLKMEQVAGHYASVTNSRGEALIYQFNADGFGGFEDALYSNVKWSWKVENGLMVAERYFMPDGNGNFFNRAETDEEFNKCISGELKCKKYQSRSYKILSKDGNRFVLRRKFDNNTDFSNQDDADHKNGNSSLWVFYKK